jgi:hypothetical protein
MPDLPVVAIDNVTAHARVMGVFADDDEYRRWARRAAVEHALAVEQARMQAEALEAQRVALAELRTQLELEAP